MNTFKKQPNFSRGSALDSHWQCNAGPRPTFYNTYMWAMFLTFVLAGTQNLPPQIAFSKWITKLASFHVVIYNLHILFRDVCVKIFFPICGNRLLVLLLTCVSSDYILATLADTCFAIIFFLICGLPLLYTFFKDYKFLILMKSNFIFSFMTCTFLLSYLRNLLIQNTKIFCFLQ